MWRPTNYECQFKVDRKVKLQSCYGREGKQFLHIPFSGAFSPASAIYLSNIGQTFEDGLGKVEPRGQYYGHLPKSWAGGSVWHMESVLQTVQEKL